MFSLGLDLSGAPHAIVADDHGKVVAEGSGADAGDAVHAAMAKEPPEVGAVASPIDAPDVPVSGVRIVARTTPGAAAVAAEAWVGAARGARHAVCLCVGEEVFAGLLL